MSILCYRRSTKFAQSSEMRTFLFLILLLHGLLHLPGYLRMNRDQAQKLPLRGWYWLAAFILFLSAALLFKFDQSPWPYVALCALCISQYGIVRNWRRTKSGTVVNLIIFVVAITVLFGARDVLHYNRKQVISQVNE